MNKRALIHGSTAFVTIVVTLLTPTMTLAAPRTTITDRVASASAQSQANDQAHITDLKTRADNEITRRITALNQIISRINDMKRVSASQKSTFVGEIQTEITNLTTLKTKIDGDTDLPTLKTDVQSIVKSYRVYMLFIPQMNLLAAADRLGMADDQMATVSAKLQTRITADQSAGQNVANLQAALADLNAKVSDSQKKNAAAIATVTPLTPDQYPGFTVQLQTARADLEASRQDLVAALKDAQTIVAGLRALEKASKTATGSATNSAKLKL